MDEMETATSDAALWSRILNEDGEAFGLLFDRHRDRIFSHSRRLVNAIQDAEDITAMVFLECWRCRRKVSPVDGSLLPWLLATANNVAKNHRRSNFRYRRLLATLTFAPTSTDYSELVVEAVDTESHTSEVQRAYQTLSRNDKEILALGVLEELPLADVAEILNVPLGTVKSRLSRAKQRLAVLLRHGPASSLKSPTSGGYREF